MIARHVLPPGAKADEEQLLKIVADQVAIAVENARLYEGVKLLHEETQERLRHTETLLAVSQDASATLELNEIFRGILTRIHDIELAAAPRRLRSTFINGVKEMRIRFTPGRIEA